MALSFSDWSQRQRSNTHLIRVRAPNSFEHIEPQETFTKGFGEDKIRDKRFRNPKAVDVSYGKYFQYINVPDHKVFEWGYNRGNKHRFREAYLSQKDHTFKAKVL